MITIRRATLADQPAIFKFIQAAYQPIWQYRIPERWEWAFVKNPHLENELLPIFIAVEADGTVVGQSCTLVEKIKIGEDLFSLGWGVDAFVLPQYRSQGLGLKLQQANDEAQQIFMSISMAASVRKMKLRLGAVAIDPLPIFRRYHGFSHHVFQNSGVSKINQQPATLIVRFLKTITVRLYMILRNSAVDCWKRLILKKKEHGLDLVLVDRFAEEMDGLWESVSPKFHAIVKRDHIHLNWKYVDQPHMDYARILARTEGVLKGYMVLRTGKYPERKFGMIADLFADPDDYQTIADLLSFAVTHFRKEKVSEIMAATTITQYHHCLKELGFIKTGEETPVFHRHVQSLVVEGLREPGQWFLGNSDHDWDQYPSTR